MQSNAQKNREVLESIFLPFILLTVVLLGGLRVDLKSSFDFTVPPLITLILAALLMLLFVRGDLLQLSEWFNAHFSPLTNLSNAFTLLILFCSSAQVLNSVLPERGLLHRMLSFFFLWTLWNNQFSNFDARRLLRSLVVLFGTAFVIKYVLLASLYREDGGLLQRLTGAILQGVTLGTLDSPQFGPATGYISFITVALYIAGLIVLGLTKHQKRISPAAVIPQLDD
jgi:hypothetical protein